MRAVLTLLMLLSCAAPPAKAQTAGNFEWRISQPEEHGLAASKLDALKDNLARHSTKTFLVIRNDRIVYEWYAPGHSATTKHYTASMAKAIVGGLSLAVAVSDELISLDDKAAKYIPQWRDDPEKCKITIRHLGSHTSGLADAHQDGVPHEQLPGWMGEFWKRSAPPNDPFTISRDQTPVLFEAGEKIQYSNPGIALLTYAVTAALKDAPQKDIRSLLRERIMRPIGAPDDQWSCGYEKTFTVDDLPLVGSWGGGGYTARTVARIGRLMLRRGDWDGRQLLSSEAVRDIASDAGGPGNCGMGWWTNAAQRYKKLPKDAYWGAGAGDQILLVVPSLNLIMVRNGATIAPEPTPEEVREKKLDVFARYHDPRAKILFEPLIDAVVDLPAKSGTAPCPPSKLITGLEWSAKETIVRKAEGSDNWPTTWGDDDHLYTAYGDGWGFEPKTPEKLSLGLARIEGGPTNFLGINIRSPTGEQPKGDGKTGKKASGMLMVDGVLFMLVRNAGNSQLAWSADRGRSWSWSDWKFTTSFGCPTFLNFGKNYAGARDNYVYVYSHDSDSAYQPGDRMVLARVPKGEIRKRDAYEFFQELGQDGSPIWTRQVKGRGAVFSNPGRCYRMTASYNAGLKRYLLCQAGADATVRAGFGIYDAPEPWGPWTAVYYTPEWDVGPGETACLPTKWMSPDGKTMHLVFAGGDSFSVRKATLSTTALNKER